MTSETSKHLKAIKAIDLAAWAVSFWLVKRKVRERDAHYSVLRVDTDASLQKRLKGYLKQQLQSEKFHLAPYDFNNADGEGTLFTIAADATDFTKVADAIAE